MRHLFILFALLPAWALGQTWCSPGATWTYHAGLAAAGFQRFTYDRDTLIDGESAQVIDRYSATQYYMPDPPHWTTPYTGYQHTSLITKVQGDVVYQRYNGTWDTLYWFGAGIGDHWYPAHINSPDCDPVVVIDTGTTVMGGMPLHWVELEWGLRVYERIGPAFDMTLYCPNMIICGPTGIRCYSDQDISVNFTNHGCETLVGMSEPQELPLPPAYPNPGTDHFLLTLPQGFHQLELMDLSGRQLSIWDGLTGTVRMEVPELSPGPYVLRVTDVFGASRTLRWLKQ